MLSNLLHTDTFQKPSPFQSFLPLPPKKNEKGMLDFKVLLGKHAIDTTDVESEMEKLDRLEQAIGIEEEKVLQESFTKSPVMESLTKNPEANFKVKRVPVDGARLFSLPSKPLIQDDTVEPSAPTFNEKEWDDLYQLRLHAGLPERSEEGIDQLCKYFSQLCFIEAKIVTAVANVETEFIWFDAYAKRRVATKCIHYEKASVLWNVASVYSQLAAFQTVSAIAYKQAAYYFQKAAGVLQYVRDVILPRIQMGTANGSDLSHEHVTSAVHLMLAQAQECFILKANNDNASSSVISQLAAQTKDYYELVEFKRSVVKFKIYYYDGLAYYHSKATSDNEIGERISRLEFALEQLLKIKVNQLTPIFAGNVKSILNACTKQLDELKTLNYAEFQQTVTDRNHLDIRKNKNVLVNPIDISFKQYDDILCNLNNSVSICDVINEILVNEMITKNNRLNENELYRLYTQICPNPISQNIEYIIEHNKKLDETELSNVVHMLSVKMNGNQKLCKLYTRYSHLQNKNKIKEYNVINMYNSTMVSINDHIDNLVTIVNNFLQLSNVPGYKYTINSKELIQYLLSILKKGPKPPSNYGNTNNDQRFHFTSTKHTPTPKAKQTTHIQEGIQTPQQDFKKLFETPLMKMKNLEKAKKSKAENLLHQRALDASDRKDSGVVDAENSAAIEEAIGRLKLKKLSQRPASRSSNGSGGRDSPLMGRSVSAGKLD